jgi:hypothetical protein
MARVRRGELSNFTLSVFIGRESRSSKSGPAKFGALLPISSGLFLCRSLNGPSPYSDKFKVGSEYTQNNAMCQYERFRQLGQ